MALRPTLSASSITQDNDNDKDITSVQLKRMKLNEQGGKKTKEIATIIRLGIRLIRVDQSEC